MPNCDGCANEHRIKTLESEAAGNKDAHKEFFSRFEKIGETNARGDEKYNNILASITELKVQVTEFANRPAKRWEGAVTTAISALVGAAIVYFIK